MRRATPRHDPQKSKLLRSKRGGNAVQFRPASRFRGRMGAGRPERETTTPDCGQGSGLWGPKGGGFVGRCECAWVLEPPMTVRMEDPRFYAASIAQWASGRAPPSFVGAALPAGISKAFSVRPRLGVSRTATWACWVPLRGSQFGCCTTVPVLRWHTGAFPGPGLGRS